MKRICTLLLVILFALSSSVIAYGVEKNGESGIVQSEEDFNNCTKITTKVYNEYDYIVSVRKEKGARERFALSEERYEELMSNKVEEELLYRAALSRDILKNYYCYTDEQIDILKEYEGDRLEDCPEMRAVAAELTIDMASIVGTDVRMGTLCAWSWAAKPTARTMESMAVTWDATYENGLNNNMRFDDGASFGSVAYRSTTGTETVNPALNSSGSVYCGVSMQFPMDKKIESIWHWAKSGSMYVYTDLVNQTTGPQIYEYVVRGQYASYPSNVSFTINILDYMSINYSSGTTVKGVIDGVFRP